MIYLIVKHCHILLVILTFLLFNLRFWLRFARPDGALPKVLKVFPHLNDTVLLFTGLWLIHLTGWIPFGNAPWLGVKLVLLLCYIFAGAKALRAAARSKQATTAYILSMACFAAIVALAYFKPVLW